MPRRGADDPRYSLATADAARVEYRRRYAEAQMIVPDAVPAEPRRVNTGLGSVYGALARMRATMRTDLDVTGPSHG